MKYRSYVSTFIASAVAAMLPACGGGGGGGGDGGGTPAPAPTAAVAITANNQVAVARSTLGGGLGLGTSRILAAEPGPTAQSAEQPIALHAVEPLLAVTMRGISSFGRHRAVRADGTARAQAVTTETEPCSFSGSSTITGDDRDNNNELSAGDLITITMNQCRQSANDLLNGTAVVSITSASETPTQLQFSGTLTYQSLTVVYGQRTAIANGGGSATFLETASLARLTLTVGSSGLTVALTQPSYSDTIVFAADARIERSLTTSPAAMTSSVNGTFSATSISGSITQTTLQPVRQSLNSAYPSSGQILAVGANGSRCRMTILSATTVRLELDADGNGAFESATDVAWSTLLAG